MFRGAGFVSDAGRKPGSASFSMGMLDEGAGSYDALAFGERDDVVERRDVRVCAGDRLKTGEGGKRFNGQDV